MTLPLNITAEAISKPCETCPPPLEYRIRTPENVVYTVVTDGKRLMVSTGEEYVVSDPVPDFEWETVQRVVGINVNA
jgi:hypothetical protein